MLVSFSQALRKASEIKPCRKLRVDVAASSIVHLLLLPTQEGENMQLGGAATKQGPALQASPLPGSLLHSVISSKCLRSLEPAVRWVRRSTQPWMNGFRDTGTSSGLAAFPAS